MYSIVLSKNSEYLDSDDAETYKLYPLIFAAKRDDIEMIKYFISKGVDLDTKYLDKYNALHAAIYNKCYNAIVILINGGDKDAWHLQCPKYINELDNDGMTPLLLLIKNTDTSVRPSITMRSRTTSRYSELLSIVDEYKTLTNPSWYDKIDALMASAMICIILLIRNGADVNIPDKNGITPLMHAAQQNNIGLVNILLGADDAKHHR